MNTTMRWAVLGLALSACGGGESGISWRDADDVNFTFGTPSSTLTEDEQFAAEGGAAALEDAPAFVDETDEAAAENRGINVAGLPNRMQPAFGDDHGSTVLRALREEERAVTAQGLALLAGAPLAVAPEWDDPNCWALTAGQIRYDQCRRTVTQDGTTMVMTLNGRITGEPGLVSWDVTVGTSGNAEELEFSYADRLHGHVAFSTVDQTIVGSSRSDILIRVSNGAVSAEGAVTYSADYDLDYTADPTLCVTGGTLTAKRFWSRLPQGADPEFEDEYRDAGVQFTWQGCGSVQVAWPMQVQ